MVTNVPESDNIRGVQLPLDFVIPFLAWTNIPVIPQLDQSIGAQTFQSHQQGVTVPEIVLGMTHKSTIRLFHPVIRGSNSSCLCFFVVHSFLAPVTLFCVFFMVKSLCPQF